MHRPRVGNSEKQTRPESRRRVEVQWNVSPFGQSSLYFEVYSDAPSHPVAGFLALSRPSRNAPEEARKSATEWLSAFFYVPDLVAIRGRRAALQGVALYVGDGATIKRSMIRRGDHALIGHSPIAAQLGWCEREGVGRAIFTHCGSEIVRGDARVVAARVRTLGAEHGVDARVAHDGLMLSLQG